jgi:cell pole-organizing protein PopZ
MESLTLVTRAADVTMAQASSVQREPSMEEILASIRRIIEDSDTARKGADDLAVGGSDAELGAVDNAVIEVDAFRAELRAARAAPEVRNAPTLAEVQEQVEAGQPVTQEDELQSAEPAAAYVEPELPEPPAETPVLAAPEWDALRSPEPSPADAPEANYDDELEAALEDLPIEPPVAAAPAVEAPAQRQDAHATVAAPKTEIAAAASDAVKPAIISEHAGRQVAAAFGELSEAFAARSRKTFDEMAEEMMRPMLQDWLDNNLPTLVERLVREEIERVARGV